MKNLKTHFRFNKQERNGVFFLLLIIILLQMGYYLFKTFSTDASLHVIAVDTEAQAQIDILKENAIRKDSVRTYPFNPNFITDYKGYTLGMSTKEIDRLHHFRSIDKYVNSPEEFQKVTQISDSLLKAISQSFKFPDWTQKRGRIESSNKQDKSMVTERNRSEHKIKDLNSATADDLKIINGIGGKLSERIIKFRDRLGGFLVDEQLYHVYGLDPEVVERTLNRFKVIAKPKVVKININTATVGEMAELIYINYNLATEIVEFRDTKGEITAFNQLGELDGFPSEKLDIIQLYLSLR